MPVKLPRRVARFNRAITNPIQVRYAWLIPPWGVICHRGRRSGRPYRTPAQAYIRGRTVAVVILYGEESDWVRNVLAGGGQLVRAGRTYDLVDPRVEGPDAGGVSFAARAFGRLSGRLLVAELSGPHGQWGRGPTAGGRGPRAGARGPRAGARGPRAGARGPRRSTRFG